MLTKKVILTGGFGVGKSSLFERFINDTFSDKYLTTVGVKVDSKVVETSNGCIKLMVWDIAGEVAQEKVPETYWLGTSGVIYVSDLTRSKTLKNMESDISLIKAVLPDIVLKIVANKSDLVEQEHIDKVCQTYPVNIITSAKTGENVKSLFEGIAQSLI